MADHAEERRLAAILAADVAGYSRHMGDDEAGTLAAVRQLRAEVIEPKIAEHRGRLFKAMGDGFLAEFPSVVNAVACAAAIQKAMASRNADLPDDRQMDLRIGVHLGDVIVDGGDVFGDGVNIAARIEALAPPGGVAISATVHDHIGSRLDLAFEDMGEQQLKNIAKPLMIYRWAATSRPAVQTRQPEHSKPSIAVLPFTNMSGDPEQDYFSDGITEDIITAVSRFHSLFVVARNSSFAFRGQQLTIPQIARRLNVKYVLEGSVRRADKRVRISAQLIEATTGSHVWSERYDRGLEDIFAVQDEVARVIASTLTAQIESDVASRAVRRQPEDASAYDYALRGIQFQQLNTREGTNAAIPFFEKAIERDSGYAEAYAWLAMCHLYYRSYDLDAAALERAWQAAQRAVALDDRSARCHLSAGFCALYRGQFEEAEFHHVRAASLNPNYAHIAVHMGAYLAWAGRPAESDQWFEIARALNPLPPVWYHQLERVAAYAAGRYDKAAIAVQGTSDDVLDSMYVAASLGQLGHSGEARARLAQCDRLRTQQLTMLAYAQAEPYRDRTGNEHLIDGLRKAGLPE